MASASYEVGNGKPPLNAVWKPGQTGNAGGKRRRPKRSVEHFLSRLLDKIDHVDPETGKQVTGSEQLANVFYAQLSDRDPQFWALFMRYAPYLFETDMLAAPRPTKPSNGELEGGQRVIDLCRLLIDLGLVTAPAAPALEAEAAVPKGANGNGSA